MNADLDTIARMAIRLGRGFGQRWAKEIPKGLDWGWTIARAFVGDYRRAPAFNRIAESITHETPGMRWTLDTAGDIEIELFGVGKTPASVQATHVDHRPVIVATSDDWRAMSENELWRVDVALTSLSCGPWKRLHALPPVRVLTELVDFPRARVAITYAPGTVSADDPTIDGWLRAFGRLGGFDRWEHVRAKP